ncbi:FtsK/SpoIIIE domain-containing protein [Saccharopolyspora sp. NPDC002686]|uniref:FtsK/SpoIIIE domain-containing protein n=1 Tax=Saccharopolyspora sp. NPDC002686 TaxID=3154541 RepID=UPI00332BAFC2
MTEASACNADPNELWNLGQCFDVDRAWAPRPTPDLHRIPFGVDDAGRPVELDFKDFQHVLCIGATGSGKSELLRTTVLGLMATHPPTDVSFVLAEFMGAATFSEFEHTPHVPAVASDLCSAPSRVARLCEVLCGELNRRTELLKSSQAENFGEYRQKRQFGDPACAQPLPALLVVLDEFSEMLAMHPMLADVLQVVGRLGNSLGVHMLLASQRLEEAKNQAFEHFITCRIALRTFSAGESRSAIGVPDASTLPTEPGLGYLRTSNGITKFKTAHVSHGPPDQTLLSNVLSDVRGKAPASRSIWLPPLAAPLTLDALLPQLRHTDDRGCPVDVRPKLGPLRVPVGLLDVPFHHRQSPMVLDLDGHGAIVGAAGSGKSTAMCTLAASLALTHTPREVQLYCVDLGGGSLAQLRDLPHVGAAIEQPDIHPVQQIIFELKALLTMRQKGFCQLQVNGMADFRARKLRGALPQDPYGDVFWLVDNWQAFRTAFGVLENEVHHLVEAGAAYGIHVFITAERWAEIDPELRELLHTRVEMRLSDPSESQVDSSAAEHVPPREPG